MDKGLISKIYKQLIQLNLKKPTQTNQEVGRKLKQTFFQKRHTDDQPACEKIFHITYVRETQIKTTMRYHPISGQNMSSKSLQVMNIGEDMKKKNPHTPLL